MAEKTKKKWKCNTTLSRNSHYNWCHRIKANAYKMPQDWFRGRLRRISSAIHNAMGLWESVTVCLHRSLYRTGAQMGSNAPLVEWQSNWVSSIRMRNWWPRVMSFPWCRFCKHVRYKKSVFLKGVRNKLQIGHSFLQDSLMRKHCPIPRNSHSELCSPVSHRLLPSRPQR